MGRLLRFLRGIWLFAKAGVFIIGLLVVGGLVAALIFAPWDQQGDALPASAVLDVAIVGDLPEKPSNADFRQFVRGDSMTLARMVRVLNRAAADDRISGLDVDLSLADLRLTDVEALLPAIARFKANGKTTRIFAENYDLARYRLASGFDEIWISPSGEFAVTGVALEMPYAGELVDRLGIKPALEQRKDFKTAVDVLKRREMASHVRVAFAELVQDIHRSALNDIAMGRNLTLIEVKAALEAALLNPDAALQNGLLDRAAYATAFHDPAGRTTVDFASYLPELENPVDADAPTIALITASGQIAGGKGGGIGNNVITDGALIAELRAAAEHPDIDGILLRIDSPGGAYGASDAIRAAMARIDKPIVASMSAVAGSGGYMIAIGADDIVAHPSTITGSIGVISGKIVVDDLLDDHGVRFEIIRSERNAAIFSPFADFTPDQQARLSRRVDAIYDAFTGLVVDARKLPPEQVEAAAQGRVWTGSQAFGLKLVDATGGFETALTFLRQRLGVSAERELHIVEFPGGSAQDRFLEVIQNGFVGMGAALQGPQISIDSMRDYLAAEAGIQLMAPELTLR